MIPPSSDQVIASGREPIKVIITIPAFNEEKDLAATIEAIRRVMSSTNYNFKVHVFDDGSIDSTYAIAEKYADYVTHGRTHRGLAKAFIAEMDFCIKNEFDVIVHTDADSQYDPSLIPEMLRQIERGADLVIGSRFCEGNRYSGTRFQNIGNRIFSFMLGKAISLRLSDVTSGFRAFTKKVAGSISFVSDFTYTHEQIIKAHLAGMKLVELPAKTHGTRRSKLFRNPWEYILKSILNLIRVYRDHSPIRFFCIPGSILLLLTSAIGIFLLSLHFFGGGIRGHLGLIVLMIITSVSGLQLVFFGLTAETLKSRKQNPSI